MTQPPRSAFTLTVDLERGVVPISRAASSLAALIMRARMNRQPIIITQKGYPTGVILDIALFTILRQLAEHHLQLSTTDDEPQAEKAPGTHGDTGEVVLR